jgi:hypothetical protein
LYSNVQVLEEVGHPRHTITKGYRIQDGRYLYRLTVLAALPEDTGVYMCLVFTPGVSIEQFFSLLILFGAIKNAQNLAIGESCKNLGGSLEQHF